MPRQQQRSSWGSIDEAVKGKVYRLRWTQNKPDGRGKCSETVYGTRKQARARLSELQVLYGKDKPVPTVRQACDMWYIPWLSHRIETGKIKRETALKYDKALKCCVLPRWGKTPVTAIKPIDIQAWLMTLSHSDARQSLVVAKSIMDLAVKYEVISTNKFRIGYELPEKRQMKEGTMYMLSQANVMFDHMQG